MVAKPINCGKAWSSFESDMSAHYNIYDTLD